MKELVEIIIKHIVTEPDKVSIISKINDGCEIIELNVSKDDVGRVIGKGGRVIKAIRDIVNIAQYANNKKVLIKIANC